MDLVVQKSNENLSIAKKLLDANTVLGEEYSPLSYINAARNAFELHEKSGLVGGALLIAIREHEDHGNFLKALDQIGVSKSNAYSYMHIAERYSKFPNLGNLNNSKFVLLDEFTDPELEKLNDGEEVRGMTIDEWETLPATKAREKCREFEARIKKFEEDRRHESNMREDIIAQKEKKIAELERQIRHQKQPTAEQIARIQLEEVGKEFVKQLVDAADALDKCKLRVLAAQRVEGATFQLLQDWQLLYNDYIKDVKDTLRELLDLIDDLHPDTDTGSGA